ncbi:glycosyl hydrolase [Boudabousia liubingyangii]|uniref:alpha-L-fucosidase n=1 Tax=Boudabousia liubingyangii TaxID=1921764 RepID=A0A1Q5PND7_9ACTO|nr:alpha-L-fucosidase [Boudabousia liubingyangii]OKL49068.1 glycosyl hydrolase [Boudabousia liubingyangii]
MGELDDFAPDDLAAAGAVGSKPDPGYIYPDSPLTQKSLSRWRDLKLGVIIHWGLYTAINQAGSWSLHRGHLGTFTDKPDSFLGTDSEYQDWYEHQIVNFDASQFDAEEWAEACADAGMRYLVFTTKHHDGFALYDTDYSNFKVTSEQCPVGRDLFKEISQAFRSKGLEIGVYYSKADWHHECYWDRARPLHGRFCNYSIRNKPQKWENFKRFTQQQISELLSRYGKINVLWLDAGWVAAPEEPIDIEQIGVLAQTLQPEILVVDREVHGPWEHYRTPEQEIPEDILEYPWESCITLTRSWCSMEVDEATKPMQTIIANLLAIVSRGGNYLIGFGPDEHGAMSKHIRDSLSELGSWMRVNGEGIYATRALNPKNELEAKLLQSSPVDDVRWDWYFTKKSNQYYLFGAFRDSDIDKSSTHLVPEVEVELPIKIREASIMGSGSVTINRQHNDSTRLRITCAGQKYAVGIRLSIAGD